MNEIKNNKCCLCRRKIVSEEDLIICENCEHIYHKICWQEVKERCIYCNNKTNKEEVNNGENNIY